MYCRNTYDNNLQKVKQILVSNLFTLKINYKMLYWIGTICDSVILYKMLVLHNFNDRQYSE